MLRGDSGFCREKLMVWCEAGGIGYVFGLAPNPRLKAVLAREAWEAERRCAMTGKAARVLTSPRPGAGRGASSARPSTCLLSIRSGANPRFVVTSLPRTRLDARALSCIAHVAKWRTG